MKVLFFSTKIEEKILSEKTTDIQKNIVTKISVFCFLEKEFLVNLETSQKYKETFKMIPLADMEVSIRDTMAILVFKGEN